MVERGMREFSGNLSPDGYIWETSRETDPEKSRVIRTVVERLNKDISPTNPNIVAYTGVSVDDFIHSIDKESPADFTQGLISLGARHIYPKSDQAKTQNPQLANWKKPGLLYNPQKKALGQVLGENAEAVMLAVAHELRGIGLSRNNAADLASLIIYDGNAKGVYDQAASLLPGQNRAELEERMDNIVKKCKKNTGGVLVGLNKQLFDYRMTESGDHFWVEFNSPYLMPWSMVESISGMGEREKSYFDSLKKRV